MFDVSPKAMKVIRKAMGDQSSAVRLVFQGFG
jgi:hypothetical protein